MKSSGGGKGKNSTRGELEARLGDSAGAGPNLGNRAVESGNAGSTPCRFFVSIENKGLRVSRFCKYGK